MAAGARFATKNVADDIDMSMKQLNEALDQMPFARLRFLGQHRKVTRAMATLLVALEDVKPYIS